jgi:hypothetical protein
VSIDEMVADLLGSSAISDTGLLRYIRELIVAVEPELALITILESDTGAIAVETLDAIDAEFAASEDPVAREVRGVVRKVRARRASDLAAIG